MSGEKIVYGRIACPHCGWSDAMRITADKSGKPFGFCDVNCGGQLRIGGSAHREREFFKAHPGIQKAMIGGASDTEKQAEKPVTVTDKKKDIFDEL